MAADLLLDRYAGAGLAVEVRWTTWELSVFEVELAGREPVFVAVRRSHLDGFLADLWAGALDTELIAQAASPAVLRRRLADGDRVRGVEVVGSVADPATLPPAERDRRTGRIGGDPPRGRRRKREDQQDGRPPRQVRGLSRGVLIGAGAAAVVLVAAVAALAGGGDDDDALTVGGPAAPPGVDTPAGPTTPQGFQGTYQVTAVVEEYAETESDSLGAPPVTPFAVGQTITFQLRCGGAIDATGEVHCLPDTQNLLIDGTPLSDGYDGNSPMKLFSADGLEDGSGSAVTEGTACGGGTVDGIQPTIEVAMDGYGEDTISGTYRHTYDSLDCPTANGGYWLLYNIAMDFTGELTDGGITAGEAQIPDGTLDTGRSGR